MEDKIAKLEDTIKFLRKELESQNMAILRLERAFESGEVIDKEKQKPVLTLADMEFTLFGIDDKLKKHNGLLKSIVISIVGVNDLLEELRDFYKSSLTDIQLNQEENMNAYHRLLKGTVEGIRTEFLMVLRDFREKYPKLEEIKMHDSMKNINKNIKSINTLGSTVEWSEEQLKDLNQRAEEMQLLIDKNINESLQSVNESINYLLTKTTELNINIKESNIKNITDSEL